jgi:hypothetical protein
MSISITIDPELLNLKEVSTVLRLEISTLRSWRLQRKHLNFIKLGGRIFVKRQDVEALLAAGLQPKKDGV